MSQEDLKYDENQDVREVGKKEITPLDSSFPLIKEFRERAPGSHKHTQSLVGMVENVCAAIETDSYILKMAATYHDIGKMWFPEIFTENQGKDNIHDDLPPWVSYSLLTRHVSDTVAILVENDFPPEVIRIASQHHGKTILGSIYSKALKIDSNTDDSLYRYKTPKPDCMESLILMLCDQIEATSRSIYIDQQKSVNPETLVTNVYGKLHLDGQFDKVHILLGDLKKIQAALVSDVASNFQKRIAYEEDDKIVLEETIERQEDDGEDT